MHRFFIILLYILIVTSRKLDLMSLDSLVDIDIDKKSEFGPFTKYGSSFMDQKQPNQDIALQLHSMEAMVTKTGTTIVGLCCSEGVVLGADTRTTGGAMIVNKIKKKIHEISNYIYCCTAGTVADCDNIVRQAKYDIHQQRISDTWDKNILSHREEKKYSSISAVLASFRRSMMKSRGGSSPQAVFIVGGYDDKGYSLYFVGDNAVTNKVPYGALGSGSMKAIAIMESELVSSNSSENLLNGIIDDIPLSHGVDIVRKAVLSGIQNDLGSGNNFDIVTITKDNVESWREEISYDNGVMKIARKPIEKILTVPDKPSIQDIEASSLGSRIRLYSKDTSDEVDIEMVYEEM